MRIMPPPRKKTRTPHHFVLDITFFSPIIYMLYEPGLLSPVLVIVRGRQPAGHSSPRRTHGKEDCKESHQEGGEEALVVHAPATREFSVTLNSPKGGITMAKKTAKKATKKAAKKR
jgi:hypothetical protein